MEQEASVLLIDDDRVWGKMILKALENQYKTYFEEDPHAGIQLAKEIVPDVILLDVVMPRMSGYDVCRELKKIENLYQVPIIFITSENGITEQLKGFDLGGIDYLVKPIHPKLIQARVRNHVLMSKYRERLERYTLEDSLTGIGNKRCFDETLAKEWKRAKRNSSSISLILYDVDDFKSINDRFGHPSGNLYLKEIGNALYNSINRSADLACRIGGDEFACLLPGTSLEGAEKVAKFSQSIFRALNKDGIQEWAPYVSVSHGVHSVKPSLGDEIDDLISGADEKLYESKKTRRSYCEP